MLAQSKSSTMIAALAGLLAVAMLWVYLNSRESQLLQLAELKDVIVARRDIPANTVLDETMIERVQLPSRYLQPTAAEQLPQAVGRVAVVPILRGSQVVLSQLDDPGLTALAYQVPRGRRAVTVAITDVTGVAGLVKPGNFVDVFGTFEFGRPVAVEQGVIRYADERTETRLMMQDVLVLATGREHRRDRPAPRATATAQTAEQRELEQLREQRTTATTVTMLVEPKQAQELILAQEIGTLSLVLRSNLDVGQMTNFPSLDPLGLLQMQIPVKKRSTPAWREMRGSGF